MKNAKKFKFLFSIILSVLFFLISCLFFGTINKHNIAKADVLYCDDLYVDDGYSGQGEEVVASYDVYFDRIEETEYEGHKSVPSFGNGDPSLTNICAPLAGTNIVGFYDRWCTNLIPNYDAGMTFSNGTYQYYPYMGYEAPKNTLLSLYNLMKTGELGGTSSANFKSGLNSYVNRAGYNISYSSFYKSSNSVDLILLADAIRNNKVGLVMCSEYNYVSTISYNDSKAHIVKRNNGVGHMMMVYGYRIISYYKDNAMIRKDTFLNVCSSYSSSDKGYMQLYDYSKIDEALIVSIF